MSTDNKEEMGTKNHSLKYKFLVEIVGTFILVYAICSAATVYAVTSQLGTQLGVVGLGQLGVIGIGLVHALVLTAIVYAIAYRTGAQVNPAVTIGLLVARKIRSKEAAVYIAAQIIGAVIAAAVVYSIFGSEMAASVTLPLNDNVVRALILETVMTFTLVYVVLTTTTSKNFKIAPLAGVAIGFTLGFNVMFGGAITGGSLNPARSFGPALIMGNFNYNWIYWVAPIMGGLIAAGVYKALHKDTDLPGEEQIKQ
jgi:MIP family channel proteins